jgi:hypothetical protein
MKCCDFEQRAILVSGAETHLIAYHSKSRVDIKHWGLEICMFVVKRVKAFLFNVVMQIFLGFLHEGSIYISPVLLRCTSPRNFITWQGS